MIPNVILNDGTSIPQLGFGTLYVLPGREESTEDSTTEGVVGIAFDTGYRHIDTAQSYGTEAGVGRAIAAAGIPRADIYVTSKLGNANHRPDAVRRSIGETLGNLGVEELDLFLMHWPLPTLYDGNFASTWSAMNQLVRDGLVRTTGVSNFEPDHLDRIISETSVAPAVNQIELHPYFRNDTASAACIERGIAVEAWSPLGRGAVLSDAVITSVCKAHDRSAAQIILRWHIQHGHIVIPKSSSPERMKENIALFDFELTADEMAQIDALDRGEAGRIGPHPNTFAQIP